MSSELRRAGGYLTITNPDLRTYGTETLVERDTIMCGHCQRAIWAKPHTLASVYLQFNRDLWRWEEVPGAICGVCWRPVCLHCHDVGTCLPWERLLDISEGRDRISRVVVAGFQPRPG